MESFGVDGETQHDRVQSYLRATLPDSKVTSESLVAGQSPLVFMWMTHLMAGFAFSNGDAAASYGELYGSFKKYYSGHRQQLDKFDLSFVFCVQPDLPNLQEFCTRVETDVYFCRKFVVPLAAGAINRAFERLPFLPLALGEDRSPRPPSAQTCMRRWGVSATLAKYLAVPHQRGAENIAKDCLDGDKGWVPALKRVGQMEANMSFEEDGEPVRLASVTVENFRAYRRRRTFDLSRPVTVLYGPNGFGKTSLFDAIDFAATGGVGRFGFPSTTERFARAAAHLDGNAKDAVVALDFVRGGARRQIRRTVASCSQATVDGAASDRKTALVELTGGRTTRSERVEHLVSLFRATHLFSQERQELAREFDRECALPAHVVAHMLAFDDYANSRRKASAVRELFEESIAEKKRDVTLLGEQVEEAERTLEDVRGSGDSPEPHVAIGDALRSLRRRIGLAGLDVAVEGGDAVFVRACRARIQARIRGTETRSERLTALVDEVRELPGLAAQQRGVEEGLEEAEGEQRALVQALADVERKVGVARAAVQDLEARRTQARRKADAVAWVVAAGQEYERLLRRTAQCKDAVERARERLDGLQHSRRELKGELEEKAREIAELRAEEGSGRRGLSRLAKLARGGEEWKGDREWIGEFEAREAAARAQLERVQTEKSEVAARLRKARARRLAVDKRVAEEERWESDRVRLSVQAEGGIRDGRCPVCRHDHGSVRELKDAIVAGRAEGGGGGTLREELTRWVAEEGRWEARVSAAELNVMEGRKAVDALTEEREEREERMRGFEAVLKAAEVAVGDPVRTVAAIGRRSASLKNEMDVVQARNRAARAEVEAGEAALVDLDAKIEGETRLLGEKRRELEECREAVDELKGDPRAERVSLDLGGARLADMARETQGEVKKIEAQVADAREAVEVCGEAWKVRRTRVAAVRGRLERLKAEWSSGRERLAEAKAGLAEFGLTLDAEESQVTRLLEEEARDRAKLRELRDFADSVEVAMDTAVTTAALEGQRRGIRKKKRVIERSGEEIERYVTWRDYFADLCERIEGKQRSAVANFAREYGPTASAIQERLRSVYGFDGIDTRSHESTIRVRVKRGEQSLRPTDYFSDSQQRTLLLGLFLTACMSQTWSTLSTVLLDDPVMHFDDLNTYAFLDMIGGLLGAGSGPGQFVLSTCDKRVLELARRRFRHVEGGARFYGISAMGREGPVVEEIAER